MAREMKLCKDAGDESRSKLNMLEKKWLIYKNYYEIHDEFKSFIKNMKRFELPRHATLTSKLKETTQWHFTFDNCVILQFFLNKFRHPFEIGRTYEEDGVKFPILILDGDGESASFYHGTHQRYITKQTHHFEHDNYYYNWRFSSHKTPTNCLIESIFPCALNTDIANIYNAAMHTDKEHLSHNTTTFDTGDLRGIATKLVHMNDREILLSNDTRTEKKRVVKVEKSIVQAPKRKIYSEGVVLKQSTLLFSTQKKQKLL